ncbi:MULTISPECIES: helix-turn-helix domain-containing protein [unclassified Sphingomonas]|uniref:helix-turn-helix domain-containing protein n=1 Tax=unclassified Sphingomonas TaxID=196159 RepID=UPI0006FD56FA|nr:MULTISPECIES: XRE family transcriptional regulator [unclassified Sphingomonas]KQX25624.1 XRE family transcriptional regulator [Sphingomonas sp. Root1294]KQY66615.1 XRE family transcriptional regulator [Sphingomonas sp. Root50]KRB90061.1 XRE family transcriptional regulator [Sphingomonas sp. Root720]
MAKTPQNSSLPGIAIRAARLRQGLTLRELATRTGLPFSTLSKLENGKMGMSYDKLVLLAQALDVDIGTLVAAAPAERPAVQAVGRRSIIRAGKWPASSSERYQHRYLAADLLGKMMVPMIIDVEARSLQEYRGIARHEGEEYLYVVSGAMELHSDLYAPLRLEQGDSIYFDSGMAHAYVRVSEEPCQVLSICAGPGIQRFAETASQRWDGIAPEDIATPDM